MVSSGLPKIELNASADAVPLSDAPAGRGQKLLALQALRFLAATMVVADHALGQLVSWQLLPHWFQDVRWNIGALGVSTFFVISGYIMMRTSGRDFGRPGGWLMFSVRRILRIVPLYWLATLLAFIKSRHSVSDLLSSLFFVPYSAEPDGAMRPLVGQGWTLNYEMFFYAMFAIALLMPLRRGIALFFALIVALVGAGLYVAGAGDKHIAQMVHFYLQPILLLFGVGVAMRLFEKSYVEHVASKRPLLLISGILTATIAAVIVFRIPNILPVWAQVVMWSPSIAVVMIAVGARPNTDMIAERVLGRLGDASYSVYLFHLFILAAIEKVLPTGVAMPLGVAFFVAALLSANVAGFVIFKFVERPITAWLLSSAERLSPKILGNTGLPERG